MSGVLQKLGCKDGDFYETHGVDEAVIDQSKCERAGRYAKRHMEDAYQTIVEI
jgi:hypothetical protein